VVDCERTPLSAKAAKRGGVLVAITLALVGCELIVGIEDVSLDPGTDASSAPGSDDASLDASTETTGKSDGSPPCRATLPDGGARPGPEMVLVSAPLGDYCIDTTEVTIGQFNAYLIASGEHIDTPPICATAIPPPLVDNDPARRDLPAGNKLGVCDAWSYCHWAGKRLCGTIGDGGSVRNVSLERTEWGFACTNGKLNTAFAYGTTYDPTACTTESDASAPVGSMPRCHGAVAPFDRIFDLSGNIGELVNDIGGADDAISTRGGSWGSKVGSGCADVASFSGYIFNFEESGFRCCANP
jgi:sulfatase modifying factor 1